MNTSNYFWGIFFILFVFNIFAFSSKTDEGFIPVYDIKDNTFIRNWVTIGTFPNQQVTDPQPGQSDYSGFDIDFLTSIGGEQNAVLDENLQLRTIDESRKPVQVTARQISAGENGVVDLDAFYGKSDYRAAYAFCYIHSEQAQEVFFLFGSDDAAKVWINGELVHAIDAGRALDYGQDSFTALLKKGSNRMLVKITDLVRDWGFVIETLDQEKYTDYLEEQQARKDLDHFLKTSLVFKQANTWNFAFHPGYFPELEWEQPYLAEKVIGDIPLQVRWFNGTGEEVQTAAAPGRYAFYAEGNLPDGRKIRRAKTVYCMPPEWLAWGERPKAFLEFFPVNFIDQQAMQKHREPIAQFAGRIVLKSILNQQDGAVLLAYLDEIANTEQPLLFSDSPLIKDHEYHLHIKRKLLNVKNKRSSLELPRKYSKNIAPVLKSGSEYEAGFREGTVQKVIDVCQKWYQASREPFDLLAARKGVILLHQAFGERPDGPVTLETTSEIASITKLLTGLLFAQFLEQGLIDLDDPVGKYLPDFPISGEKAITLRQCFVHTTGLWSHEEWGGVHNPWLDNAIAQLLPELPVGRRHEYNGMGYDLAGKVMEIVSGKSIFRLFQEHLFDPLGLEKTMLMEDLAFSCHTNARELAVIAQMLLNKGAYGNRVYFSEKIYEQLLPQDLNQFYRDVQGISWGIGITEMAHQHPQAGKDGNPDNLTILSKNMIGHGSATSSIFQVDPENELVITQTRRRSGSQYNRFLEELLLVLQDGLLKE